MVGKKKKKKKHFKNTSKKFGSWLDKQTFHCGANQILAKLVEPVGSNSSLSN